MTTDIDKLALEVAREVIAKTFENKGDLRMAATFRNGSNDDSIHDSVAIAKAAILAQIERDAVIAETLPEQPHSDCETHAIDISDAIRAQFGEVK